MSHTLHRLAHTTPKTRAEIRALCEAGLTPHGLIRRDSVGQATIVKWQRREDVEGRSHRAHTRHTGLSAAQALIVVEWRRLLAWPLDEPRAVTRRFIDPDVSRSGLNRFLQREGLGRLRALPLVPMRRNPPALCASCQAGHLRLTRAGSAFRDVARRMLSFPAIEAFPRAAMHAGQTALGKSSDFLLLYFRKSRGFPWTRIATNGQVDQNLPS